MKVLIKIFQFIFIIGVGLVLLVIFFLDFQDICLDSGYCKEGLLLNVNGKSISVNEQSCRKNNGVWIQDKRFCQFK